MASGSGKALLLKEDGNRHFQTGDYVTAEALYSKALIADSMNPALYTNRAMARLKMSLWDGVIEDCNECLRISSDNMKAHHLLAQAYLPLHDYDDALDHALRAHKMCVETGDKNMSAVTAQVLKCKKERWEAKEKRRCRETADLETEVLAMLERERDDALRDLMDEDDDATGRHEIETEWGQKIAAMRDVFEKTRPAAEQRRTVPDWAIDDITFGIMVDPVITKTGKSYERAAILEHLRRHPTDPLTREPLYPYDLRSNLDLKQACEEFLDQNGWAVDW